MTFRFTYSATGRPTYTATGNPSGWDSASIGFERDPKLLSLVEFFKSSFSLYGNNGSADGARQWFLDTEAANGADSLITQLVEIDDNDDGTWEEFFTSVIAINTIVESYNTSHLIDFTLSQADFWAMFIKRFQTPVDLKSTVDLDGNVIGAVPSFTLPLPCQVIQKTTKKDTTPVVEPYGINSFNIGGGPPIYLKFAWDLMVYDEIETRQSYPTQLSNDNPVDFLLYDFKIKEAGSYLFKVIRPVYTIISDFNFNGNVSWWITTGKKGAYTTTQIGATNNFVGMGAGGGVISDTTPDSTLILTNYLKNLSVDDEVYIYGILNNTSVLNATQMQYQYAPFYAGGLAPYTIKFELVAQTSVPDTSCDAFLTHDIARGIVQRITDQDLFVSNLLGNPYTSVAYGAVGCGSMLANMLGLHIRGYKIADKPFQLSMQDWWDSINPILCMGLGYEKIGGVNKIACESAEHFFDDSNVSVQFMNITDIKRSYDTDWQFNQLKVGFEKWQSQAASGIGSPSGIDDPQSQRTWVTRFKIIGKAISQLSKMIMASLTIETARRLGVNQSSNYTYDNDIFGIALYDNGGGAFVPETNQSFSAINNLLNSTTRYNSSHTPARILLRWSKYWSGCLQDYLASFVNFASGVGNFLMSSIKTTSCPGDDTGELVAENGNFPIGTDYLFLPTPLAINHYIDWPTYKHLRDNKNWAIEISQTETNFVKCFIKTFSYNKADGKCSMVVWPKTKFTIQEIESIAADGEKLPGVRYFDIYHAPEFE